MYADGAEPPFRLAQGGARGECSTGLEGFKGEAAGAVVFGCDALEDFDGFGVFALADEVFRSFFETDHEDARHGHDENKGARGVPDVTPALVVGPGAGRGVGEDTGIQTAEVGQEAPCEEARYQLTDT